MEEFDPVMQRPDPSGAYCVVAAVSRNNANTSEPRVTPKSDLHTYTANQKTRREAKCHKLRSRWPPVQKGACTVRVEAATATSIEAAVTGPQCKGEGPGGGERCPREFNA
ncbi:unnamed protein product [Pleuronectes platessa]|uniref:Uncharacterized protein n=1 Tax=Pleuronectes platessa TaxID=8262 RepID=A0A9N7VH22_PLEPL|nr:unnamed protein product [Pleuronectes platessa]